VMIKRLKVTESKKWGVIKGLEVAGSKNEE
jgi:hypothetical protein